MPGTRVAGPVSFSPYGDLTDPAAMVLRVRGRDRASDVETYECAEVLRVIHPGQPR
jgi:hypothetical protein